MNGWLDVFGLCTEGLLCLACTDGLLERVWCVGLLLAGGVSFKPVV